LLALLRHRKSAERLPLWRAIRTLSRHRRMTDSDPERSLTRHALGIPFEALQRRKAMTPMIRTVTKIGFLLASVTIAVLAQGPAITPSRDWVRAMPSAPVAGRKIRGEYAALVGRDAYFWAWPLVNVYNRRLTYEKVREIVMAGPVPAAPLNRLGMLSNYISPEERIVACPNQDVVYGAGSLALDQSPVVIQVPDFGDRF